MRAMDDRDSIFECCGITGYSSVPWWFRPSRRCGRDVARSYDNYSWQQFSNYRRRLEILVESRVNKASELILQRVRRGDTAIPGTLCGSNMVIQTGFGFPLSAIISDSPEVSSAEEPISICTTESCSESPDHNANQETIENYDMKGDQSLETTATNSPVFLMRDIDMEFDAIIASNPESSPSRPNELQLANDLWIPSKILEKRTGSDGSPDMILVAWTDTRLPNKWVPASDRDKWDLGIQASVAVTSLSRARKSQTAKTLKHFKKNKWLRQWLAQEAHDLVVQKSSRDPSSLLRKPSRVSIFKKLNMPIIESPVLIIGAAGTYVENPSYFESNETQDLPPLISSGVDIMTMFSKLTDALRDLSKMFDKRLEEDTRPFNPEELDSSSSAEEVEVNSMPLLSPVTPADKRSSKRKMQSIEHSPPKLEAVKI